jgi:hypothetical protein
MAQKPPDLDASGRISAQPPDIEAGEASGGMMPWLMGAGALGLGAAGLVLHNQGLLGKAAQGANELRRSLMLSGLALPKSIGGAIGGSALASIERGSIAPLKEMLSPQTVKDAVAAFKSGPNYATSAYNTSDVLPQFFHIPGRMLGAGDTAAQLAFQRAGLTAEEAASEMLQTPLGKNRITNALEGPVGDYFVPFRRTPFNQLIEGFNSLKPENLATTGQKAALAASVGAGAVTGAEAEDPKTIALGTAMAGRRGVPFAMGALAGRLGAGSSKRKAADAMQGISPVSDYSLSEGVAGPLTGNPLPKPAIFGAYDYVKKMLGMQPPDLP